MPLTTTTLTTTTDVGIAFVTDCADGGDGSSFKLAIFQIFNNYKCWDEYADKVHGGNVRRIAFICVGADPEEHADAVTDAIELTTKSTTKSSMVEIYLANKTECGPVHSYTCSTPTTTSYEYERIDNFYESPKCNWIVIGGGPPVGFNASKFPGHIKAWFQVGNKFIGKHMGRGINGGDNLLNHPKSDEYKIEMDVNMEYVEKHPCVHMKWVESSMTRGLQVDAASLSESDLPDELKQIVWNTATTLLMVGPRPLQLRDTILNLQQLVGCTADHPEFGPNGCDKESPYFKDNMIGIGDIAELAVNNDHFNNNNKSSSQFKGHSLRLIKECYDKALLHAGQNNKQLAMATTVLYLYQSLVEEHGGLRKCIGDILLEKKKKEEDLEKKYTYAPLAPMDDAVAVNLAALWCVQKHTYDHLMAAHAMDGSAKARLDLLINHFDHLAQDYFKVKHGDKMPEHKKQKQKFIENMVNQHMMHAAKK